MVGLGKDRGGTRGIDVDAFGVGPGNYYSYVRLTDDISEIPYAVGTAGADIDAVKALSSGPPVVSTPEPSSIIFCGLTLLALAGVRRFRRK